MLIYNKKLLLHKHSLIPAAWVKSWISVLWNLTFKSDLILISTFLWYCLLYRTRWYKVLLSLWMKTSSYWAVLSHYTRWFYITFEIVIESYWLAISYCAVHFSLFYKTESGNFFQFLIWSWSVHSCGTVYYIVQGGTRYSWVCGWKPQATEQYFHITLGGSI